MRKNSKYINRLDYNALFILTCISSLFALRYALQSMAAQAQVISPLPDNPPIIIEKPIYKTPVTTEEKIIATFGEYAPEAFALLECENKTLNPNAINHNSDGSVDYGMFQLNDNWHGFKRLVNNPRYLFDPDINIAIAYRLFVESGYSFKLWTCGK